MILCVSNYNNIYLGVPKKLFKENECDIDIPYA